MTTSDEFAFIALQLEWLEAHLRAQPPVQESARMEGAINALACARSVIVELDALGRPADVPLTLAAA